MNNSRLNTNVKKKKNQETVVQVRKILHIKILYKEIKEYNIELGIFSEFNYEKIKFIYETYFH